MTQFHLALYRGASADIIYVADYLEMNEHERDQIAADFKNITISLLVNDEEQLAHRLSLGSLKRIVSQLKPAQERLQKGLPALIRSGVLDVPDGNYLLFEPQRNNVLFSVIRFDDLPESGWFPDGRGGQAVYDFVGANRERLIAMIRETGEIPVELPLEYGALLDALSREATAGEKLLNSIVIEDFD